jgi:hypothetical protein
MDSICHNTLTTGDGKTTDLGTTVSRQTTDTRSPEEQLADFQRDVNRLYDRQAINALLTCAGQIMQVKWPPRPLIYQVAGALTGFTPGKTQPEKGAASRPPGSALQ